MKHLINIYEQIREAEYIWKAYDALYWGRPLSKEILHRIMTDKENRFVDFMYQLRDFYTRRGYFQDDRFKRTILENILGRGTTESLSAEEVDVATGPFINALHALGNQTNTQLVIDRFVDAVVEFTRSHYGNPEIYAVVPADSAEDPASDIKGLVDDFLWRSI